MVFFLPKLFFSFFSDKICFGYILELFLAHLSSAQDELL